MSGDERAAGFAEFARRYSELGWALIRATGKKGIDDDWQTTQPLEPGFAAGQWGHWGRTYNLGIVCAPSRLAVLDVDRENADEAALELLGTDALPETPIVRTGRERLQIYFRDPGGLNKRVRDGFELRVGNHMCVAPPSVHPDTGRTYAWLPGRAPWETQLAELPARVLEFFAAAASPNGRAPAVGDVIPERERNNTLASLAGSMRDRGMGEAEILAALQVANRERCRPPLAEREVAGVARSIATRYKPKHPPAVAVPAAAAQPLRRLAWQTLEPVVMHEAEFVERPLLQAAAFTLLAGRPDAGKGVLCAHWVARCTNGQMYGRPRNAVWLSSEDSPSIDMKPRLVVAGGDPSRAIVPDSSFKLPADVDALRELVTEIADVGLIVIDPLGNHTGVANTDRDPDLRVALMPLNELADEISTAIGRILGGTAWVAIPRVVLVAANDGHGALHVQAQKGNRVPPGEAGRKYQIEGRVPEGFKSSVPCAVPLGASDVDVNDLLSSAKDTSRSQRARGLILELLAERSWMESDELDAQIAEQTGLAARTVQNVRVELGREGLIRSQPERDEVGGEVKRWIVKLTNAGLARARGGMESRDLVVVKPNPPLDHEITFPRETGSSNDPEPEWASLDELEGADWR
jgi:Bifunctional DNA primase/polymerase, N-terminal/AAA domain/Primase C terminal 1 (PriCT-1)